MIQFSYAARGGSSAQGKARIYFTSHPDDFRLFEEISTMILDRQNCAVYYLDPGLNPEKSFADGSYSSEEKKTYLFDLRLMQLFVVPVTTKLLTRPNRARDVDLPFALKHHIPILPLMQESGLEQLFNVVVGEIQSLNPKNTDVTAIGFDEKLKKFLDSVIVGDEMMRKIQDAFDAYIFLSYRKKDRYQANRLMRLIHASPAYRDIAIWYDEFLVPGENFNDAIRNALAKSAVFVLTVTPHLLEKGNYVREVEFPMAVEERLPILPVEMYKSGRDDDQGNSQDNSPEINYVNRINPEELAIAFRNIGEIQDEDDKERFKAALEAMLQWIERKEHGSSPEEMLQHQLFIGLAYLSGIDVETDHKRAVQIITDCAEKNYLPALNQLVSMYENGNGVARNYNEAAKRQETIAAILEKSYREKSETDETGETLRLLIEALSQLGDKRRALLQWQQAEKAYGRALEFCETRQTPLFRRFAAATHSMLGLTFQAQGQTDAALKSYETAYRIRKDLSGETQLGEDRRQFYGILREIAESENRLADLYLEMGKLAPAYEHYSEMERALRELDRIESNQRTKPELGVSLHKLCLVSMSMGQYDAAERYLLEDLALSRQAAEELNSPEGRRNYSVSLQTAGDYRMARGDLAQAEASHREALALSERIFEETETISACRDLSISCEKMSDVCLLLGDLEQADTYLSRAAELAEQLCEQADTRQTRTDLGTVYFKKGQLKEESGLFHEAWDYYQKSLGIAEELCRDSGQPAAEAGTDPTGASAMIEVRSLMANDLHALGMLAMGQGDTDTALRYFRRALQLREELQKVSPSVKILRDLAVSCHAIGDAALADGEIEKAEKYCRQGYQIAESIYKTCDISEAMEDYAISLDKMGNLTKKTGDRGKAGEYYRQALSYRQEIAKKNPAAEYVHSLAVSYYKIGILDRSRPHLQKALEIWSSLADRCPDAAEYANHRDTVRKKLNDLDLMEKLSDELAGKPAEAPQRVDKQQKKRGFFAALWKRKK